MTVKAVKARLIILDNMYISHIESAHEKKIKFKIHLFSGSKTCRNFDLLKFIFSLFLSIEQISNTFRWLCFDMTSRDQFQFENSLIPFSANQPKN